MTRRYTKKNKAGIRGKSTLLSALKKMESLHKAAKTNHRLRSQNDLEGTLNKMATWLVAATKCPPRHYGKVWNDEKDLIVKKCQDMYLDAQKYKSTGDAFMGHIGKNKTSRDGDGRFMPLHRLRFNMATAKWDFTNTPTTGSDPYWNSDVKPGKVRIISDQNEKSWALNHLSQGLMVPEEDTRRAYTQKVTQTYAEWRLASGLI